jgi:tetratricopeptide (TPR) repeat protein
MSKPNSPSTAPEFASQHDYSDILGTAMPPARQPQTAVFADPWATDREPEIELQPQQSPSVDPWADDAPVAPPQSPKIQPAVTNPTIVQPEARSTANVKSVVIDPVIATPQPQPRSAPPEESPASAASVSSDAPSLTAQDLASQYCKRGQKALAAKDYAQARSAYKVAIEWNPNSAIAHSGMAQVYTEIQDFESALVAWDSAIRCDATQLAFYYQRALINKSFKNYFQVLADCQYILDRDPDRASARWLKAISLVKLENYQDALADLDRHIQEYPKDPNGYCYRGICHERLDWLPEALADLDRAISLQFNQPVFHHARGRTRQKMGDLPGALADFNITIERKPQAAVFDDRAEVRRCLGDREEALQDCDRAIELNPKFINAYFRRGLIHTELGNLELALGDYSTTLDLDPDHVDAYIQRSWTYFRQKDYPRTKRDCKAARAIDKSCFWAYYLGGVVYSLAGLRHNAIKNFSRAVELSPNYVSARYHRGIVYHQLGDIPSAMADFELARSLQDRGLERMVDRDETGFYAEGLALYYLGQPEAARTVLILGALSAKRFNNRSFHQLLLSQIEELGMASGELSSTASNSRAVAYLEELDTLDTLGTLDTVE